MRFPDIDGQEFDLVLEFFVEIVETDGPLNIGRSSETAKDQGDRFFTAKGR